MNLTKFLKSFPPPRYIDVPFASIVFSDSSIRFLVLDKKNKHPLYYSEIPLDPGVIESGKVKNEDALAKTLSQKLGDLKTQFVKFSIPDEAAYVFSSKVPVVPGKDASEAVSFILEENVPLPLADISFDYVVQKVDQTQTGFVAKVAVVAVSTSLVVQYLSSLRKAGLEPLSCLSESQATANAVIPKNVKEAASVIHIRKQSAGIYVVNEGVVEFSSVVPIVSLDTPKDLLSALKSEVERAVEYSTTKIGVVVKDRPELLRSYLCGEYENMESILEQIRRMGKVEPVMSNVWSNSFSLDEYVPDMPFEDSLRFAGAIGLYSDND